LVSSAIINVDQDVDEPWLVLIGVRPIIDCFFLVSTLTFDVWQ
jgi:predicted ABC-type sugar transport system permease subunit